MCFHHLCLLTIIIYHENISYVRAPNKNANLSPARNKKCKQKSPSKVPTARFFIRAIAVLITILSNDGLLCQDEAQRSVE